MAQFGPNLQKIMSENADLIQRYNDYMEIIRVGERKKARDEQRMKEKGYTGPYSPEMWAAANAAANARLNSGVASPEPRFPIILNDVLTLEKVQEIVGDALVSADIEWTTEPQHYLEDDDEGYQPPQKFPYCVVEGRGPRQDIEARFDWEWIVVWFEGRRRYAVLAHKEKEKQESDDGKTESINGDGE